MDRLKITVNQRKWRLKNFDMTFTNLFVAVFVTSVGCAFQNGYHMVALNVPLRTIEEWISANSTEEYVSKRKMTIILSSTVSIFAIGGIFGGFLIGIFADKLGRKGSLKYNNFIVLAAITLMTLSKTTQSYKMLLFGRFLAGVNTGLNSGLCPMYLIEISPDHIRGAIGSTYHFFLVCAVVVSEIVGCFLGTEDNWPYIFVIAVGPAILQLVLLPICPESPKFLLITKGKDNKAKNALKWLRDQENVEEELELLKEEDSLVKQLRGSSLKRIFRTPALKNALICCLVLHISQQVSGMNMEYLYSSRLIHRYSRMEAGVLSAGIAIMHPIASLVSLLYVDKYGRRKLMNISLIGQICSTILMFITGLLLHEYEMRLMFYPRVMSNLFWNAFYSIGLGPIPWYFTAELFHHTSRSVVVCLTVTTHWLFNFVISQCYLILKEAIGSFTSVTYIILDIVFFLYLKKHLLETAKISAIELIKKLGNIEEYRRIENLQE